MAALDTFEWYVASAVKNPSPELKRYLAGLRQYAFSLRSEDERQRFVEQAMAEIAAMIEGM